MMGLSAVTIWWVAAGIAVAAEFATGTFYLLMMALGLAAGALAAHLGLSESTQVVCAAVVGGGATALWHWRRSRRPPELPARRGPGRQPRCRRARAGGRVGRRRDDARDLPRQRLAGASGAWRDGGGRRARHRCRRGQLAGARAAQGPGPELIDSQGDDPHGRRTRTRRHRRHTHHPDVQDRPAAARVGG